MRALTDSPASCAFLRASETASATTPATAASASTTSSYHEKKEKDNGVMEKITKIRESNHRFQTLRSNSGRSLVTCHTQLF